MRATYQDLEHGISCIDTRYIRGNFVACYLIQQDREAALIDSGGYLSVPGILKVLDEKNIAYSQVKHIILTHIHLDHAGGAGELLKHLPNAKVYVHERGAKHLIDPSKLRAGVIEVYGKTFFKQFLGDLIPINPEKIHIVKDQERIMLESRVLTCIDTPGHAKHHICIWDEVSRGIFSGDTLGVSYQEFDTDQGELIFPPTTPIQFDPEVWEQTVRQLMGLQPRYAYLTHYGRIEFSQASAQRLIEQIQAFCTIALTLKHEKNRHQVIKDKLLTHLLTVAERHGASLAQAKQIKLLKGDLEICAQGLGVWLDQQDQKYEQQ